MIRFALDISAPSPLYRQIQEQIQYAISVGELVPGDTLPSIREVEANVDVNRNTVRRAYLELQQQGVLLLRQGREAVVAESPRARVPKEAAALGQIASDVAMQTLMRGESLGIDSMQFADLMRRAAVQHDARLPKLAFVECSIKQAEDFARDAERRLGRHVRGIDLHELRDGMKAMPPSVRCVLTPHWHATETRKLLESSQRQVVAVGVRLTDECQQQMRGLDGESVGLVVRDTESLPGYRKRLGEYVGQGTIKSALAHDRDRIAGIVQDVSHVIYTTPCEEIVRTLAPSAVETIEFEFVSAPEHLEAIRADIFPCLNLHTSHTENNRGDEENTHAISDFNGNGGRDGRHTGRSGRGRASV